MLQEALQTTATATGEKDGDYVEGLESAHASTTFFQHPAVLRCPAMPTAPMMQQYDDANPACGDAIPLFGMRDFYELFLKVAKLAASIRPDAD
jgi:hypothetical protein